MKKRRKKTLPYQKGVVRLPHFKPMYAHELDRLLYLMLRTAEDDVEFIHQGKRENIVNLHEANLVEMGLVMANYYCGNKKPRCQGKRTLPARKMLDEIIRGYARIGRKPFCKSLDDSEYPGRLGLHLLRGLRKLGIRR